jgi:hypothetical protein
MVKHLPGYFESDLRIRLEGRRPITFEVFTEEGESHIRAS